MRSAILRAPLAGAVCFLLVALAVAQPGPSIPSAASSAEAAQEEKKAEEKKIEEKKAEEKKKEADLFKLELEKLLQTPVAPAAPTASSAAPTAPSTASSSAPSAAAPTLSPQQLVSSVSRQESTVAKSPTGVFVITQEMIRRSRSS